MKFVYEKGPLQYFEGLEFIFGKPVEVTNPGTLSRIVKAEGFRKVEEVEEPTEADPQACPKCGRVIKRGRFIHVKHCKGLS